MEKSKNNLNGNVVYDTTTDSSGYGLFMNVIGILLMLLAFIAFFMDLSKAGNEWVPDYLRATKTGLIFQQVVVPFLERMAIAFLCFAVNPIMNRISKNRILQLNIDVPQPANIAKSQLSESNKEDNWGGPVFTPEKPQTPEYFFNQGMAYYHGTDCQVDYSKAVKCFHEAALNDNPEALYMLGVCYHRGEGVMQDNEMATNFLKHAADAGSKKAKLYLMNVFN